MCGKVGHSGPAATASSVTLQKPSVPWFPQGELSRGKAEKVGPECELESRIMCCLQEPSHSPRQELLVYYPIRPLSPHRGDTLSNRT